MPSQAILYEDGSGNPQRVSTTKPLPVQLLASGGATANQTSRLTASANSTNSTLVKAGISYVHRITVYNANAAARYLKLYNKATAPTIGTDVPIWTEYLPPTSKTILTFDDGGLYFSLGIGFGTTTGVADNDTAAVSANDLLGLNIAFSVAP